MLEQVWDVVKWVLLVLAAGFIGQFGKSFALRLLERRRNAQAEREAAGPSTPPDVEREKAHLEAWAKTEKKRAKAEVKRAKKSSDDRSSKDAAEASDEPKV